MRIQKTLIFELSKEQTMLPCAEILACLDAMNISYTIIEGNEDVLLVEGDITETIIQGLAERLAFTFYIDEILFFCPATLHEIVAQAERHPLQKTGTIAIRCKSRSSTLHSALVIDRLGDVYTKNRKVNLTTPDIELRAIITEKTAYIGIKKAEISATHFQQRRGHLRPFLSPITLHPKIARALVNLSAVKKNQVLLDPFCGTGGILIEAGFLGVRIIGSDIEKKMIEGCQKNLEFYHLKNYQLYCADIGDIYKYVPSVDAVVTDFPYAKATTTKGEQLQQLYTRGFEHISTLLQKNKRAVIGLSNEEMITIGENFLSLVEVFPLRAHRSLTRYFVVYKK
jgi:tRNA (guanine10-N2)-dimethyltransferase